MNTFFRLKLFYVCANMYEMSNEIEIIEINDFEYLFICLLHNLFDSSHFFFVMMVRRKKNVAKTNTNTHTKKHNV